MERGLITEIGWSAERLFRRSRSTHMLWYVVIADVGQFSQIWSDCDPMRSDEVISHTTFGTLSVQRDMGQL